MPLTNPVEEFRLYFQASAPSGLGLGWGEPVWWGQRQGSGAQIVLTPFGIDTHPELEYFTHYAIQIACWHPVQDIAALRALTVHQALLPLQDASTAAQGITLPTWRAQTIQVAYKGVVDAIEITGTLLYAATCDLHLINLEQA